MNSRWSRIGVSAAGMYIELLVSALALLIWATTSDAQIRFLMHNVVLTAGISTILFNANPLMRFDGYYILSDWIDIPNLWSEGSQAVRNSILRLTTGRDGGRSDLKGWRKPFVLLYGIVALFWRVVVCGSLLIAASTMFAGAGVLIAALGLVLWVGRPLKSMLDWATDLYQSRPFELARAVMVGGLASTIVVILSAWLPIPSAVTSPAIVRYLPETNLRTRADGFISKIHVSDGDWVQRGDLLVELENFDLVNQLKRLEITWQQNELRSNQAAGEGNAAKHQLVRNNQLVLEKQIETMRQRVDGLRITATRDGRVISHDLDQLEGTFIQEGDSLMHIARQQDKEIVAVIDQNDIPFARRSLGEDLTIRANGFLPMHGKLDRIEPRASQELQELALSATAGGPLAVQPSDRDANTMRLLEPHFKGRIQFEPTDAIHAMAGLRTRVALSSRNETLIDRLKRLLDRIIDDASIDMNRR